MTIKKEMELNSFAEDGRDLDASEMIDRKWAEKGARDNFHYPIMLSEKTTC